METVNAVATALTIAAFILTPIYNLFLHPLRTFPGPLICRASSWPRHFHLVRGSLPLFTAALHKVYGPVVRVAPGELSFISPQAWRDIYLPLPDRQGARELKKDGRFYSIFGHCAGNIMTADFHHHELLRRQLSPGFSDRTLRLQEPIIQRYVDILVGKLRELSDKNPINLTDWFTYLTFDIISRMSLGSDLGCLDRSQFHPWVHAIKRNLREFVLLQLLAYFDLGWLNRRMTSSRVLNGRCRHEDLTRRMLQSRLEDDEEHFDIISVLQNLKEPFVRHGRLTRSAHDTYREVKSFEQLHSNMSLLILAGSETSATLMTGFFSLLAENAEARERVTREVRAAFSCEDEITLAAVKSLSYLLACIHETLRLLPPTPNAMPRLVGLGGHTIAGHHVPQHVRPSLLMRRRAVLMIRQTVVYVAPWAAGRSEENFTLPLEFHPERFLQDPTFAGDSLGAAQPFGIGHRSCLGRSLAYAETQLALAKMLYNFEVDVSPGSLGWTERQKAFVLWDKTEMTATVRPIGSN
ncbi:hypothetical protein L249_0949 [Ophiocordyceps polyrhachis-furcata BCC 54312]|uniref:Cytochrome P450 n=1 Tax=Ophiocordyceps polyrhachis-furcata BCC 54312 TaxID=1330021 RepID=A0A367LCG1_9HYPO|nr:hypothetical protein L249_0949 [Ophiocordyceps polyrhachis-furcata BCC 54312]